MEGAPAFALSEVGFEMQGMQGSKFKAGKVSVSAWEADRRQRNSSSERDLPALTYADADAALVEAT